MAKKNFQGPSLFDLIDEQVTVEKVLSGEKCEHKGTMEPSLTIWPGETCERMTMTCRICKYVRGWYPGEPTINDTKRTR